LKLLGKEGEAIRHWLDVTMDVKDAKKQVVTERAYGWARVAAGNDLAITNLFQGVPAQQFGVYDVDMDGRPDLFILNERIFDFANAADTDAEFLKRVLLDVRGNGPTALELKYFTEDKDPKKREKLIDTLLKEPAVQKKLGDTWKKKVLAPAVSNFKSADQIYYYVIPDAKPSYRALPRPSSWIELIDPPVPPTPPTPPGVVRPLHPQPPAPPVPPKPPVPLAPPQADKLEKLVGELIAAKKSDEAVLEAGHARHAQPVADRQREKAGAGEHRERGRPEGRVGGHREGARRD